MISSVMFGWGKPKNTIDTDAIDARIKRLERDYFGLSLDIDQIRDRIKSAKIREKRGTVEEAPNNIKKGMLSAEEAKALAEGKL